MAVFTLASKAIVTSFGLPASISLFGSSVSTAALVSAGLQIGVGIIASRSLLNGLEDPGIPPQEVQATLNQPIAPRRRGYGLNRLGGVRVFWEAKKGILYQIIVHHEGPIAELVNYVYDGSVATQDPEFGRLSIERTKIVPRVAAALSNVQRMQPPRLMEALPDLWTEDHRLDGCVASYVEFSKPEPENFNRIFPRSDQTQVQIDAKLAPVFDPRTGVTGYSDNPALCVRDYLLAQDGARISPTRISSASVAAWADVNDEVVPTTTGTEKRYRVADVHGLNESPKAVLGRLLRSCDASVYLSPEGQIAFLPGVYSEPDVTITDDDILELNAESGRDALTDFNVLKGVYTSPDHGFQQTPAPEWRDEADLALFPEKTAQLEVRACPSGFQMQRLMRGHVARQRPEWRVSLRTNAVGIKARFPKGDGVHTIRLETEKFPNQRLSGVYEVLSHSFDPTTAQCQIELASIANVWDVPASELQDPPPSFAELQAAAEPALVPEELVLSQGIVAISAETNGVQIIANVADPDRDDLQLVGRYRANPSDDWSQMAVAGGTRTARSTIVSEGTYTVEVYWLNENADEEDHPSGTITVLANPTAPAAPSFIAAVANGPDVDLSWRNGVGGFARTRVYRNTANNFGAASIIAEVYGVPGAAETYTDTPVAPGTYFYWLLTVNPSGVVSAQVGPESATV